MSKQESILTKIFKNSTVFCIDLDEKDSYIIDDKIKSNDK